MKIRGQLVDWLCEIDPTSYLPYVVYEQGVKTLDLLVLKVIYGMLMAGLLWYRKLRADLEATGFVFNDYNHCVANKIVKRAQQTIRFHVDDILPSHVDKQVNDNFYEWAQNKYGFLKEVTHTQGKIHQYLGMTLDFSVEGKVHVKHNDHIKEMIKEWLESITDWDMSLTPTSRNLYEKGEGGLLSDGDREIFHQIVVKGIFVCGQS